MWKATVGVGGGGGRAPLAAAPIEEEAVDGDGLLKQRFLDRLEQREILLLAAWFDAESPEHAFAEGGLVERREFLDDGDQRLGFLDQPQRARNGRRRAGPGGRSRRRLRPAAQARAEPRRLRRRCQLVVVFAAIAFTVVDASRASVVLLV